MRLQTNLANLLTTLRVHRQGHPECERRFLAGGTTANHHATRLPLSHATNRAKLRQIWGERCLRSRRHLNGGNPPANPDGTVPAEVPLGTDNDVFLFLGPIRFECPDIAGVVFAPSLEIDFPREMAATPFDSGGLMRHFVQKTPAATVRGFLESHELPVPHYRSYVSEFTASLFDSPEDYFLSNDAAACEIPIVITGGNPCLRRSFEIRFREQIPLIPGLLAVFFKAVVATEPWAKNIITECRRLNIHTRFFETEDGCEYDHLVQATVEFVQELLR